MLFSKNHPFLFYSLSVKLEHLHNYSTIGKVLFQGTIFSKFKKEATQGGFFYAFFFTIFLARDISSLEITPMIFEKII